MYMYIVSKCASGRLSPLQPSSEVTSQSLGSEVTSQSLGSEVKEDTPPPDLEQLCIDKPHPAPDGSGDPKSSPTVVGPQTQSEAQGSNAVPAKSGEEFPLDHLLRLDEQLNRPKWVVPVRPDDDLERLLRASIRLCREGVCPYQ